MAIKTITTAKRVAARTKKVLAATEIKTDSVLLRLAASPYTVAILFLVLISIAILLI